MAGEQKLPHLERAEVECAAELAVAAAVHAVDQLVAGNNASLSMMHDAIVFALANPGGQLRVTFGLVSAVGRAFRGPRGRRIAGSIEHTAIRAANTPARATCVGTANGLRCALWTAWLMVQLLCRTGPAWLNGRLDGFRPPRRTV